ncbi:hypothetical protein V7266_20355 [Neobacillus drentensis]|uniref:hypothetical protein n=1 Tax=Neobacillus drentensis TaxID=220684 RepID=UPI00300042EE
MWIYLGVGIGVISNNQSDVMRLVTEIPMTAGIAFLGIFALLLVIRILISFFEQIRLFKEDNIFYMV